MKVSLTQFLVSFKNYRHQTKRFNCLNKRHRQLKELGKHPQIPALLAYFQHNQYFYLVQEFIEGNNLAQVIEEEGTFNETQIWQFLKDLLPVFKFISDRNIIHRDIKPANIICRTPQTNVEGNFVLVDFACCETCHRN